MKLFVALTDRTWFDFLALKKPEEVNFWRPSSTATFRAIAQGELLLFKLHAPVRAIVGGGVFMRHAALPMSLAWEAFGELNGSPDRASFYAALRNYRRGRGDVAQDPVIGNIIISAPFFFEERDWISEPQDWSPNIVQGKTYSTDDAIGMQLYEQVFVRLGRREWVGQVEENQRALESMYGRPSIVLPRLGQGGFRLGVTAAYEKSCTITGERTLPVLDASHIRPFSEGGPSAVSNGLLIRKDLHALFDRGYLTVNEQYRVEVSKRIREDYGNGREYYALHGRELQRLPIKHDERPARSFLLWHNENVYVGLSLWLAVDFQSESVHAVHRGHICVPHVDPQ